jgi:hypothetical protein
MVSVVPPIPAPPSPRPRDSATGLPIYSLYGSTFAPTAEMLTGVQVFLVDLPDAGARYFTYVSTTIELMKSPAMASIPVIILDRPDPVGGAVQGNVLDSTTRSFVGSVSVPMRHGLTPGELALLAQRERGLATKLIVVPVSGWRRSMYFDATGLPFDPPSPNLRDLESIISYSGTCLFEGTNLSTGRGSDAPFSQIGAPWLDPDAILARLGPQPGVALTPTTFIPRQPGDGKYADTLLHGIRLRSQTGRPTMLPRPPSGSWSPSVRCIPPSSPGIPSISTGSRASRDFGRPWSVVLRSTRSWGYGRVSGRPLRPGRPASASTPNSVLQPFARSRSGRYPWPRAEGE